VEGAGGIGDTLGVVAARVGDHTAGTFFFREGGDFVVGAAEFEGADGLLVFRLEQEAARIFGAEREVDQGCTGDDALQAGLRGAEIGEGNHLCLR
jgi:hypothetical protein